MPLLDTLTKYSATPSGRVLREGNQKISCETGEILSVSSYNPLIKWELQHAVKSILGPSRRRLFNCCSDIRYDFIKAHKDVEVRGGIDRKPYYVGLNVCGCVWLCPVCAAKIQAYRALEVRAAIDAYLEKGGSVWMVTQTIPHTQFDDLEDMMGRFAEAFKAFKSTRKWRVLKDFYKMFGYIKALEVTWGVEYGWHPHLHTIFFLDVPQDEFDLPAFHADLFAEWQHCTAKQGFGELSPKAFTVQDASKVKEYLNKMTGERYLWGSEHEITKLYSKQARGLSYAPFDFLRVYNESSRKGGIDKAQAAALFKIYADAFHGRRHLIWSNGLKKALIGGRDKTDKEIAESIGEIDIVLATITHPQWRRLLKLPDKAWRGELLDIVQKFGQDGFNNYFESKAISDEVVAYNGFALEQAINEFMNEAMERERQLKYRSVKL